MLSHQQNQKPFQKLVSTVPLDQQNLEPSHEAVSVPFDQQNLKPSHKDEHQEKSRVSTVPCDQQNIEPTVASKKRKIDNLE